VYIRQSSLQQVAQHQESTRLQYALVERATHLGWPSPQVEVIDEDLGRSGASAEGRPGFQRLVAEVSLGQVGLVLGIEMSRLARSCRDWYQLLEICALYHTLIGDQDGIYDPSLYNDRLLLGLKGTMSEAELHLLKQRMHRGLEAKAKRGELPLPLPMGYVRTPSGVVIKDPDAQVQATVALVFSTFDRQGSIGAVLRYFVQQHLQLPRRVRNGAAKGELVWGRPSRSTLSDMIHHPMYAGVYAYGRRPVDPRKKVAGKPWSGRTMTTPEHWMVCLHDRLPAYISWDDYLRHVQQLRANCPERRGVSRNGTALLSGLLRCGRCGRRMRTCYSNNGQGERYLCDYERSHYGGVRCQSITGAVVDTAVRDLLFQALEPAALEVSLQVAEDLEQERQRVQAIWQQRVERARYQADRVFRQYTEVEPEHRLVARALEQQWEEALRAEQEVQAAYAQFLAQHPVALTARERADIQALAHRLPAVWEAPTTTQADRQSLVRQVVEQVRVTVEGDSERVMIEVEWVGGQQTRVTVIRRVTRLENLSYYPELAQRVQALVRQTLSPARMAAILTQEGWHSVSGDGPFTAEMVSRLLRRHPEMRAQPVASIAPPDIAPDEWTVSDLAGVLDMPHATVYTWIRKRHLQTRRVACGRRRIWLITADPSELARLRGLRAQGLTRHSLSHVTDQGEHAASSENGSAVASRPASPTPPPS
jgi:DNA invertase Pin-like site-specific DNA recombinase